MEVSVESWGYPHDETETSKWWIFGKNVSENLWGVTGMMIALNFLPTVIQSLVVIWVYC